MYALLIQFWLQITVRHLCNFFLEKEETQRQSKWVKQGKLKKCERWHWLLSVFIPKELEFQKNSKRILLVAGSEKLYFRWSLHSLYIIICIVWEAIKWVSFLNHQVTHGYTIIKDFLALIVHHLLSFVSLDYYNGFHWSPSLKTI